MNDPWFIIDLTPPGCITAEDCETKIPPGFKTFKEWQDNGFLVRRGERATWFNGVAYFSKSQVEDAESDWEHEDDSWFDPFDPNN